METLTTLENEPLSNHTTFKIGGPAKEFLLPSTVDALANALMDCVNNGEKFFILGGGSNLVFADEGFSGKVICTRNVSDIFLGDDKLVHAQAGATISAFVNFCKNEGLCGFETFAGLPGTIGGAVFMNARCFEVEVSDVLESVKYLDMETGKICDYAFCKDDWAYKKSPFNDGKKLILEATFRPNTNTPGSDSTPQALSAAIDEKCKYYINERRSKGHFEFPSAGSVFKNNHDFGKPSGKIIDEAGLRGFQMGGAKVADFHGNFIINVGNATAADVKGLVEKVKAVVLSKYGFALEEEIIFVG